MANKGAESAHGEFFVLGNGEIHPASRFDHDQVAAHLSEGNPASLLKGPGRGFARDVGSRPMPHTATTMGRWPGLGGVLCIAF